MFDALKRGFREAQNRLAGLTELTAANIQPALREVRLSLLEADVELGVVKRFLARVEERALGQTVRTSVKHDGRKLQVSASDQFIKVCHDELVAIMRPEQEGLTFAPGKAITKIMMVGLQGSGKTTSCAKLALKFKTDGRRPLLVAADMQRPAAVEQLKILGEKVGVPVFNLPGESPVAICRAAEAEARRQGCDTIVYDTAGRLAIDEALMDELVQIQQATSPNNILLVVDAMVGQDAVQTARGFNSRLGISGVILTKLDGDARGGAALSVKDVTGAPVLFVGTGETADKLEEFRPEGMAGRVLGLGDVVGLMKDFEEVVDQKQAEKDAEKLLSGQFTLEDFLGQVRMIRQMGPLKDLIEKMPGMGAMLPPGADLDEKEFGRIEAIIQSMTRAERADAQLLVREPGRARRVARGSGNTVEAVSELVQKFVMLKQMMGGFGAGGMGGMAGMGGLLGKLPGMRQLAMARNMRRAAKSGKLQDMMAGMGGPGGLDAGLGGLAGLGAGLGGGLGAGGENVPKMRAMSRTEKNQRKGDRKRERAARKRGRSGK